MAIKIKSLKKCVDNNGLKILVHGPAGAGKTVLCATAGEPTLVISAEGGLLSIRNAPEYIKAAEVKTLEDIYDLYEYLYDSREDPDFKWVALDSITEIAETVLDYEKARSKDPRKAYGDLQTHMMKLLRDFRDLPGYNVIMTCKQQRVNEEALGLNMYMPMMPGAKLAQQIPYIFDEVFALRVEKDDETKEEYRVLQTNRDSRYEAKDRSGILDIFEEPNLKKLFKKIMDDMDYDASKEEKEVEVEHKEKELVEEPPHCTIHKKIELNGDGDCPDCLAELEQEEQAEEEQEKKPTKVGRKKAAEA